MQNIEHEILLIHDKLLSIEKSISNINMTLEKIERQSGMMENHVINVESVINSTPFTMSFFRAFSWKTLPHLLYRPVRSLRS